MKVLPAIFSSLAMIVGLWSAQELVAAPSPTAQSSPVEAKMWPCRDGIVPDMRAEAGVDSVDCAAPYTSRPDAVACANRAFAQFRAFIACETSSSMEGDFQGGVVGLANGDLLVYYADSFGPALKGRCRRRDVAVSERNWPTCTHSLLDKIDLITKKPIPTRGPGPFEEQWSPECSVLAFEAATFPTAPQIYVREWIPLVEQPEKYGLRCEQIQPDVELVVDRSGRVACARVIEATKGPPPEGLYEEIRNQLLKLKFEQPSLNGKPITMIRTIHLWTTCPGNK